MIIVAPTTETELQERAIALAGRSLAEIAAELNFSLPLDFQHDKGIVGQLIELYLGATSKGLPQPDFPELNIELKTIPINSAGHANESTFVCVAQLKELSQQTWQTSLVRRKLARVLWVPILIESGISLGERTIGMPLLWSPSPLQEAILQKDWQELTDLMSLGQLEKITAHHGDYLQIRPKAANAKALCKGVNAEGELSLTLPRGFYLRALFTNQILQQHYAK